jgi:hypothetical protein
MKKISVVKQEGAVLRMQRNARIRDKYADLYNSGLRSTIIIDMLMQEFYVSRATIYKALGRRKTYNKRPTP